MKYIEIYSKSEMPEDIIWEREIVYGFKQLGVEGFHITQTVNTRMGKRLDGKIKPLPYPQVGDDLTIDKKGIVLKDGDNFNFPEGHPSYLWLPADKRKMNDEPIKAIRKVGAIKKWEGLEVFPVHGLLGDMYYYDVHTGILVGAENINGKLKMLLIDTNYAGLKTISADTL
ncbi:MAG: hypothetical protein ABFR82_06050 [Nitrospirota bacterium]